MLSEGRYRGFLEEPEIIESAKQATPGVKAWARVADPTAGDSNNSRIEWNGWLTEKTADRTIQSLLYAGCTFPPKPGDTEPNLADFTGCGSKEVEFQVEIEEYTPEQTEENPNPRTTRRPRVAFVNPVGQSRTTKPVSAEQKAMVSKSFGGLISKIKDGLGKAKASDTSFDPAKLENKKLY